MANDEQTKYGNSFDDFCNDERNSFDELKSVFLFYIINKF